MRLQLTIKYENVFESDIKPNLSDLLFDIPSSLILRTLAWINSEIHYKPTEADIQKKIFKSFFERSDHSVIEFVLNKFTAFKKTNGNFIIFQQFSIQYLIEFVLCNYNTIDATDFYLTPENEVAIFKAILYSNSIMDFQHGESIINNTAYKLDSRDVRFYKATWPILINQYEISLKRNVLIQAYYGFKYLDFLEQDERFSSTIDKFRENEGSSDPFISQVIRTYLQGYVSQNKEKPASSFPSKVILQNPILETYVLDIEDVIAKNIHYKIKENYKSLRENPIIKVSEDIFLISNWQYLLAKVYRSFIFSFHRLLPKKEFDFGKYKSIISDDFAEKILFEKVLKNTFSKVKGKHVPNLNSLLNFDFYFRHENRIFLFEFKDVILPYKSNYIDIKNAIDEKFVAPKGIAQLIKSIKKISERFSEIDDFVSDGIPKERIIIYPVLVYTEPAMVISGFNDYLNKVFRSSLPDDLGFFMVRNLVLINLDFFYDNYDSFRNGDISMQSYLDIYYQKLDYLVYSSKYAMTNVRYLQKFQSFEEISSGFEDYSYFIDTSLYKELMGCVFQEN